MLVWIVYMPDADLRGPDLDRMNRVEDVPDELGRMYLGDGSARVPSEEEIAAYEQQQAAQEKAASVDDLSKLTRDELVALLPEDKRAEVPPRAKKSDVAEMVKEHRAGQATDSGEEQPSFAAGGPVVTVTPGAGENHDPASEA